MPVSHFDEDKFISGHAFDGSSIAGWKGIEASDMQLIPDPNSANIDPFFEETTLILTCDVIEPSDGKAYDRDPRSIAKRAEAYLKASGLGDTAYFGPEPEFFIFDGVRWYRAQPHLLRNRRVRSPWNTGSKLEGGNRGHRPTVKGGYFPVPPVDSTQDMRAEMSLILESWAFRLKCSTTKWLALARTKSAPASAPWSSALTGPCCKVRDPQRGQRLRQDRHLHAQALPRRQRLRHARAPVRGKTARTCSLATATLACLTTLCTTLAASSSTPVP